ncbi:hypothetical protein [Sulfurimonas sp.]|uniref:hypothetical protein n=1 Tax=Sulfurimonas sp. TaxID=2022749 RepID=UPI003D0A72A3
MTVFKITFYIWTLVIFWSLFLKIFSNILNTMDILFIIFAFSILYAVYLMYKNIVKAQEYIKINLIIFWILFGFEKIYVFLYSSYIFISKSEISSDVPMAIVLVYINTFVTLVPPIILSIILILSRSDLSTPHHTKNKKL